ncbi:MAG: LytR/AlgR family response regulator transcription factor [Candidatus Rokuibacteriota bacterium]
MSKPLRAYLVDDNAAASLRLARVLKQTGRVEVVGSTTQPLLALAQIPERDVDVLFLDIQMPKLDGFELLERLQDNPQVVFVTGHDEYAQRAFDQGAVDYLMKPVTRERLAQTLDALEARRADPDRERLSTLLLRLADYRAGRRPFQYAERISIDRGQHGVWLIEVAKISHFVAQDDGTLAMTDEGPCLVEHVLGELENRLDPRKFVRIHRSVLVNLDWVQNIVRPLGGGLVVRMTDRAGTELQVARERVRGLKERFIL